MSREFESRALRNRGFRQSHKNFQEIASRQLGSGQSPWSAAFFFHRGRLKVGVGIRRLSLLERRPQACMPPKRIAAVITRGSGQSSQY